MAQNFSQWLGETKDSDTRALRDYVKAAGPAWQSVSTLAHAQDLVEADTALADPEKHARQIELARAFMAYGGKIQRSGWAILAFGPSVVFLMVIVLGIIAFGIFATSEPSLLDQLSQVKTARGLITFIFALGVMSLALIIVSANFIATEVTTEAFNRAKEVFTSLVAILGTILGFYFGVGLEETAPPPPTDEAAQETAPPAE